jgi:hypothetical protein
MLQKAKVTIFSLMWLHFCRYISLLSQMSLLKTARTRLLPHALNISCVNSGIIPRINRHMLYRIRFSNIWLCDRSYVTGSYVISRNLVRYADFYHSQLHGYWIQTRRSLTNTANPIPCASLKSPQFISSSITNSYFLFCSLVVSNLPPDLCGGSEPGVLETKVFSIGIGTAGFGLHLF